LTPQFVGHSLWAMLGVFPRQGEREDAVRIERPQVDVERPISSKEFERLLQRAEKLQKLGAPRMLGKLPPARKRPASAA
jgi:hypothetical protein